jgi:hypothetical protein
MMDLVSAIGGVDLGAIEVPTIGFYALGDVVVRPDRTEDAFARLGAPHKRLVVVTDSTDEAQHVIAGRVLSPGTVQPLVHQAAAFVAARPRPSP